MSDCDLTVIGQENVCRTCGVRWDLSDKEPPQCANEPMTKSEISEALKKYKETLP